MSPAERRAAALDRRYADLPRRPIPSSHRACLLLAQASRRGAVRHSNAGRAWIAGVLCSAWARLAACENLPDPKETRP